MPDTADALPALTLKQASDRFRTRKVSRAANARPRTPEPGNTRALDDYGLPTITAPCGFSKTGLPAGLQISGPSLGEVRVLPLAALRCSRTPRCRSCRKRPPVRPLLVAAQ